MGDPYRVPGEAERGDYNPFRALTKAELFDRAREARACACISSTVMREILRREDKKQAKLQARRTNA